MYPPAPKEECSLVKSSFPPPPLPFSPTNKMHLRGKKKVEKIRELTADRRSGAISEAEFATLKRQLLEMEQLRREAEEEARRRQEVNILGFFLFYFIFVFLLPRLVCLSSSSTRFFFRRFNARRAPLLSSSPRKSSCLCSPHLPVRTMSQPTYVQHFRYHRHNRSQTR